LSAFEPKPRGEKPTAAAVETKPLLEVKALIAGYGPPQADGLPMIRAVDEATILVQRGRNLGIIGESGCGKSTLARSIAGILPAFAGQLTLDGHALPRSARQRSREQLRELQIVFQHADTSLNPAKSIEDILGRPLTFYHGMKGRARDARVDQLLDMVHLPKSLRSRTPAELSGGQKQRVNFARALAAEPKLILCDEITSALDTVVAAAVIDLLKELQRELSLSYIFISHDLSVVEAICDEIVVMYRGKKVEQITPAISKVPQHPYSKLLFSSVPKLDRHWLDGLERDPELVKAYAQA
jgi:peptide/nickel transport system ATP-binding protein